MDKLTVLTFANKGDLVEAYLGLMFKNKVVLVIMLDDDSYDFIFMQTWYKNAPKEIRDAFTDKNDFPDFVLVEFGETSQVNALDLALEFLATIPDGFPYAFVWDGKEIVSENT